MHADVHRAQIFVGFIFTLFDSFSFRGQGDHPRSIEALMCQEQTQIGRFFDLPTFSFYAGWSGKDVQMLCLLQALDVSVFDLAG